MAKGIRRGKVSSVSNPDRADFVYGSRPDPLRDPLRSSGQRVKPGPANTRDYGKKDPPPLAGNTGMTGLS